jgi:hypothetical protein
MKEEYTQYLIAFGIAIAAIVAYNLVKAKFITALP